MPLAARKVDWNRVATAERAIYGRRITSRTGGDFTDLAPGMEVLLNLHERPGYQAEPPGEFWYHVLAVGEPPAWPHWDADFRARIGGPGSCGNGVGSRLEDILGMRQPPGRWLAPDGSLWRWYPRESRWYCWPPGDTRMLWVRSEEEFRQAWPDGPGSADGW
jgi:hypothetical protein